MPGLPADKVKQFKAEATFIRAADYYYLWELFGPVPLITTAAELNLEPQRATDEAFNAFLAQELEAAANDARFVAKGYERRCPGIAGKILPEHLPVAKSS
jgi:hypothetical protein